jgi:hypothetical protein
MKNPKRGTFLKSWAAEPAELEPAGSVPRVIGRLKLPALPVGSMFAWYFDRVDKQRCQMAESRRGSPAAQGGDDAPIPGQAAGRAPGLEGHLAPAQLRPLSAYKHRNGPFMSVRITSRGLPN